MLEGFLDHPKVKEERRRRRRRKRRRRRRINIYYNNINGLLGISSRALARSV